MSREHVVHEITRQSRYLSRKCPIRLQTFMIGDQVIICQRTGAVFSLEGFNECIGDWRGNCPYCQGNVDVKNIPQEYEPKTYFTQSIANATELETEETGALGLFWIKRGNRRGQFFKINHGTTIGRVYGNILLDDKKVSKRHAKITFEDDQFLLWDFGSTNGTFVNGHQIRETTALKEGDVIRMGQTEFVFKRLT